MINARKLENKDASSQLPADLLQKLLDSPLAKEMQRSMDGAAAARRKAAEALEALKQRHDVRYAAHSAKARELIEKRDSLKIQYEAARLAAMEASDLAVAERDSFARRKAELRVIVNASASYLESEGLDSAEAITQRFGL